jgi:death on curing protein
MTEYLSTEQILYIHDMLLGETGGASGMRDAGLLDSALGRSAASFGGQDLYPSMQAKAAALMHSLVSNHPFVDGNKRVAIAATELFLRVNGYFFTADNDTLFDFTMACAASQIGHEEIRIWIEQHCDRKGI